jgi:hypothetical protein
LAWLSRVVDLDAKAREFGALVRVGKVRDGASLLRLALLYGPCGLSRRAVAAAAATVGMAVLSDKAVLGRLRKMSNWLGDPGPGRQLAGACTLQSGLWLL